MVEFIVTVSIIGIVAGIVAWILVSLVQMMLYVPEQLEAQRIAQQAMSIIIDGDPALPGLRYARGIDFAGIDQYLGKYILVYRCGDPPESSQRQIAVYHNFFYGDTLQPIPIEWRDFRLSRGGPQQGKIVPYVPQPSPTGPGTYDSFFWWTMNYGWHEMVPDFTNSSYIVCGGWGAVDFVRCYKDTAGTISYKQYYDNPSTIKRIDISLVIWRGMISAKPDNTAEVTLTKRLYELRTSVYPKWT